MSKLTLIVPSIHPERWKQILADMAASCVKHDFEIIFVGPSLPPEELVADHRARYLKDFGCPSRCLQLGSLIAEGEYLAWTSDDAQIQAGAFDACIDYFDTNLKDKDGMTLRYSEGENFTGVQHDDPTYWVARTHTDLRLAGVKEEWKIAPLFMYKLDTFRDFGGLDCRFEHVNLNTHDLAFAIQEAGGKLVPSPVKVIACNWSPVTDSANYSPIFHAFVFNDRPLFTNLYNNPEAAKNKNRNIHNWRFQPAVWQRRFK